MKSIYKFLLEYDKPEEFVQCQWCHVSGLRSWYVIYRCVLAVFFTVTMFYSILSDERNTKWLIYFTNWSFLLCTIQTVMGATLIIRKNLQNKHEGSKMPISYKFYWLFHTTSIVFTFSLTAFYWTFLYKSGVTRIDWINLQVHGINAALLIIDLFLVRHPFRIQHIYISFFCSLLFPSFTLIYHFTGGTNRDGEPFVYKVMDWTDLQGLVGTALGQSTILIMHVVAWIWYLVKMKIYSVTHMTSAAEITKYSPATII